jgi:predicted permease
MLSRSLRGLFLQHPGLTIAVVSTLAAGIAAVTTTFGIVNAALLRQPPFPRADRIAVLYLERRPAGEPPRRERWSFARFERLRQAQQSFDLVASCSPASVTLSVDGTAELARVERVSAAYFPLLGAAPVRGRFIDEADDDPASPAPVTVIAHDTWSRRFAADPDVVGRTIKLNGVALTVVGVAPPEFGGLSGRSEFWVPRTISPQITYREYLTTNQNFIAAIGRLRTGVDLDAARSELAVLGGTINRALPSDPRFPDERATATATSLNEARVDPTVRRSLLVLLGAVSMLHLLACANVINLLLGRAAARRREYAVRMALGSSARRLFAHVLSEGAVLALVGGAAGIGLGWAATQFVSPPANLWPALYGTIAPFDTPAFSWVEVTFGAALTLATMALVAGAPALLASRADIEKGLRVDGRHMAGHTLALRRPSIRGVIVGVEAALAALLVVAAGLLLDSFPRIRQIDIGVHADRVLTFWVIPSEARIPPADAPAFVSRLIDSIARTPGVESVSVDGGAPLSGSATSTLYVAGRPAPAPGQAAVVTRHYVGPDHFRTLGIPVVRGRAFLPSDTAESPRVAVISESAARRFWPDEDPIGSRVWFGGGSNFDSPDRSAEIVGIVRDVRYQTVDQSLNSASFYTPYTQFTYASRMVFVRTTGDPMSARPAVARAVAAVDPELALQDVRPLEELATASWARRRFDALLFSGFGAASLLLAATGIFAVLAHSVETRRREFGIRIALGAGRGPLIRHVVREGLAFPVVGLFAGITASMWLTRFLQSSLYETSTQEPRVFAGMAVVVLIASAAACIGPAWRATRANPVESLRSE